MHGSCIESSMSRLKKEGVNADYRDKKQNIPAKDCKELVL